VCVAAAFREESSSFKCSAALASCRVPSSPGRPAKPGIRQVVRRALYLLLKIPAALLGHRHRSRRFVSHLNSGDKQPPEFDDPRRAE
jgi:hypothetical protein